jgi:hypothetical protein
MVASLLLLTLSAKASDSAAIVSATKGCSSSEPHDDSVGEYGLRGGVGKEVLTMGLGDL